MSGPSGAGRIDACGAQDLPDGGRRDSQTEFRQFAVHPAVAHILLLTKP